LKNNPKAKRAGNKQIDKVEMQYKPQERTSHPMLERVQNSEQQRREINQRKIVEMTSLHK